MDRNFNKPVALQITFLQVAKGGLISEKVFHFGISKSKSLSWALSTKEYVLESDYLPLFRDLLIFWDYATF